MKLYSPGRLAGVLIISIVALLGLFLTATTVAKQPASSYSDGLAITKFALTDEAQIVITKTTTTPLISVGDDALFVITVHNTGNAPLTNIQIDDPKTPSCTNGIDYLGPGDQEPYNCAKQNVYASFTNTATVTAFAGTDVTVSASDSVYIEVGDGDGDDNAKVSVEKTTSTPTVANGGTAKFTIAVENTGDVTLFNLETEDPKTPSCEDSRDELAVGAVWTIECELTSVGESFVNTVTVVGEDGDGGKVENSDSATITVNTPAIRITKTAVPPNIFVGEIATFVITIENTGDTTLYEVEVSDPDAPNCDDDSIGTLAPEQEVEYECDISGLTKSFTNTATVTAVDSLGEEVSDSSTDTVSVKNPDVALTITPPSQTIDAGDAAQFQVKVENTGNRTLKDVEVISNQGSQCASTNIPDIKVNEFEIYNCSVTGAQEDFVLTLTVTTVSAGKSISDDATALVEVENNSAVTVAISPDIQTVPHNGTAEFTVFIFNNGNVPLNDVSASRVGFNDCDFTVTTIPPNFVLDYVCLVSGVTSPFVTTFEAEAIPENNNTPVNSSGLAYVNVAQMDFDMTPQEDQIPSPGGRVRFDALITNLGNVDFVLDDLTAVLSNDQTDPINRQLLNNSCDSGETVLAGQAFSCSFEINIVGAADDYDVTVTTTSIADGVVLEDEVTKSVEIRAQLSRNVYLSAVTTAVEDEPNNSCADAFPIQTNTFYSFFPNDPVDLYTFNLTNATDLEIRLTNFTPLQGQIVLYRGDCSAPVVIANNGNTSSTKVLNLQNQPAGNYIILVVTDGTFSTSNPYNLLVNTP